MLTSVSDEEVVQVVILIKTKLKYCHLFNRYTLKAQGQGAGAFNIGPSSGIVKLAKELDFEDLRQPHIYQLLVTATEDSGGFSTSVEVRLPQFYSVVFLSLPNMFKSLN